MIQAWLVWLVGPELSVGIGIAVAIIALMWVLERDWRYRA